MLSENLTSLFFISEEFTKRMLSLSLLKLVRQQIFICEIIARPIRHVLCRSYGA